MYERKAVTLKNKESIAYLEQGSGDNYLILIHGNTSSSVFFSPLLARLPDDIHVIAPDLRGFGDSSYINRFDSLLELAEDLNELLNSLWIKRATILGWSLGGGVAMELAATFPDLVEKLILVNSTIHSGYPIYKKDATGQPIIPSFYANKEEMSLDPVQVLPLVITLKNHDFNMMNIIYDNVIYTLKKPNAEDNELWINEALKQRCIVDADWALARLNMSNTVNSYMVKGNNKIRNIVAPTLHTFCEKDFTTPKFMVEANANAIKNSTIVVYPNSGHSPFVDVPDQLTKDILSFLNS